MQLSRDHKDRAGASARDALRGDDALTQTETDRRIETVLEIEATAAEVWKAITEAVELSRWFPLEARVKPGVGGRRLAGRVVVNDAPYDYSAVIDNMGGAYLRVRVEPACDGTSKMEAYLSLGAYGVDDAELDALEGSGKRCWGGCSRDTQAGSVAPSRGA